MSPRKGSLRHRWGVTMIARRWARMERRTDRLARETVGEPWAHGRWIVVEGPDSLYGPPGTRMLLGHGGGWVQTPDGPRAWRTVHVTGPKGSATLWIGLNRRTPDRVENFTPAGEDGRP